MKATVNRTRVRDSKIDFAIDSGDVRRRIKELLMLFP
jgi:hypothetical protein